MVNTTPFRRRGASVNDTTLSVMKKRLISTCSLLALGVSLTCMAEDGNQPNHIDPSLHHGKTSSTPLVALVSGSIHPSIYRADSPSTKTMCNMHGTSGKAEISGSTWECTLHPRAVPGQDQAMDLEVTFRLKKGVGTSVGVSLGFDFTQWSQKNYVLLPGAVYNGNRFRAIDMAWPSIVTDPGDRMRDIEPIITNATPHLTRGDGPSRIDIKTYNESTPAVAFHSPFLRKSFILLTKPSTRLGVTTISVEETVDRSKAAIVLTSPPAGTLSHWKAGDAVTISCRIFVKTTERPIDLLKAFFPLRKSLSGQNQFENTIPFSRVFQLEEDLHNTERWDTSMKYYRQAGAQELHSPYSGVQLGWIGGMMEEQPLLVAGSRISRERSKLSIDTILSNMQAGSGMFYGLYKDGTLYSDDLRNVDRKPLLAMTRRNGDGLYFLLQNMMYLKQSGEDPQLLAKAELAARLWADGMVHLWTSNHQFGQLIDVNSGKLVVFGSTAGASTISALTIASQYFHDSNYLDVAEAAAELYYHRDLENGYTTGGPGEAIQCPDSESAFALVEAYVDLYDVTSNATYLAMAENAAAYSATWVTSYDYVFPTGSDLGKAGLRATGSVWANTQNKHGAPAICTNSGIALLKLYRVTKNPLYLELLRDISHNAVQYVSTKEKPLASSMLPGYVCERVNIGDWEGKDKIGGHLYGSSPWAEVAIMLSVTQIPGIYIDKQTGKVTAFDHVDTRLEITPTGEKTLWLKNPTGYDATYAVYVDEQTSKPMGWDYSHHYKQVVLQAGKEMTLPI